MDRALHNLTCKRVQADEIHSFVFAKSKNADQDMKAAGTAGDVWTWTAICADSKLAVSWMVGRRNIEAATVFIDDVASRLAGRIQLSTDGHKPYLNAIAGAFGNDIDYGRLIKYYKPNGDFMKSERMPTVGAPDRDHMLMAPKKCGQMAQGAVMGRACEIPRRDRRSLVPIKDHGIRYAESPIALEMVRSS